MRQVWSASLLLSDYIIEHRALFRGCSVLELGAGPGKRRAIATYRTDFRFLPCLNGTRLPTGLLFGGLLFGHRAGRSHRRSLRRACDPYRCASTRCTACSRTRMEHAPMCDSIGSTCGLSVVLCLARPGRADGLLHVARCSLHPAHSMLQSHASFARHVACCTLHVLVGGALLGPRRRGPRRLRPAGA